MGKLSAFNFITLNGFFKGTNEDISWNKHGKEEEEFSAENLKSGDVLLFGRVTYEMMEKYWTSPIAMETSPIVAGGMNRAEKIVFSRTLKTAHWNNTKLINENIIEEIKKIKKNPAKDLTILGSGSILTLFTEHGLIDEYQVMIYPTAIGQGTPLLNGIKHNLELKLIKTRTFKSGTVLLSYQPVTK